MATLRDRKLSKRALERDVAADMLELSDAVQSDESDDLTYGTHGTKAQKRKKGGVLQALKRQSLPSLHLDKRDRKG